MAAKKAGTAVAKKAEQSTALAHGMDMSTLVGDGAQQQFAREDLVIPFLKVLQSMSPYVKKSDPLYVKGAEEGMFFNTATQRFFEGEDRGLLVVPVAFMRSYTEWKLIENGGGLVRDHGDNGSLLALCTKDIKGRNITPAGTELVDAALYYLMVVDEDNGTYDNVAFLMKGTQWKKARQWNTKIDKLTVEVSGQRFKPAMFYHAWRLTTVAENNEQGSWFGVNIQPEPETTVFQLPQGTKMYTEARNFSHTIKKGEVKVRMDEEGGTGGAAADDDEL